MSGLLKIIILLIFVLPILGGVVLQVVFQYKLANAFVFFDRLTRDDEDDKNIKLDGVNVVLNTGGKLGYVERRRFKSLTRFGDVGAKREMSFVAKIDPRWLLKEGEALPKKEFLKIFMEARGLAYGKKECQRFIDNDILSNCIVRSSGVNGRDRNKFFMMYKFGFVQKESFGTFDKTGAVSYHETKQTFSKELSTSSYTLERAEKIRLNLLLKAKAQCAVLKERQGNCAISSIYSNAREYKKEGKVNVSMHVVYSFLDSQR